MSGNVHFWRGVYEAAEYCAESIYTEIGIIPRLTIIGTGGEHTLLPCFDAERGLSASVLRAVRAYMIWVNASCFFSFMLMKLAADTATSSRRPETNACGSEKASTMFPESWVGPSCRLEYQKNYRACYQPAISK